LRNTGGGLLYGAVGRPVLEESRAGGLPTSPSRLGRGRGFVISDFSGWQFWLGKLDEFNGNYIEAETVEAFITSLEYRKRFGPQ
jgi:hypothetical protein